MNATAINTIEPPFAILPHQIQIDPHRYYKTTRDICYWTNEVQQDQDLINEFIEKAREYNYSEEQALAVLTFNHYDYERARCDLHIYRPIKGLAKVEVKQIVKMISDGISKTVKSREHRDFDDILLLFPGFTIGDILGAYSKHRFLIKKQTYRVKKSIKKSINKPFVVNGGLKENNDSTWYESCLDTQFQLVYQKHYQLTQNCNNIQDIISRDLSEIKQSNKNGIKLADLNSYVEADGILNLLRKMNRKRNKVGSPFDRTQLLNILNSTSMERMPKSTEDQSVKEDGNFTTNPSPCLSALSTSPNAEIASTSSKEPSDESLFEEKLHDYVKGDIKVSIEPDELDFDGQKISESLKALLERHEQVLNGFKTYLPNPNVFHQLSHSWDNMDFAILLLGLKEYGKDFSRISDAVFTKSESMVRSFYLNYQDEFNFSEIIPQPSLETFVEVTPKLEEISPQFLNLDIKLEPMSESELNMTIPEPDTVESETSTKKPKKRKTLNKTRSNKQPKASNSGAVTDKSPEAADNVIVTRSLRSRVETIEIMKTLIEHETKSYARKPKRSTKRKTSESGKSCQDQQSCKQARKN